jgi:hypothetical protein
MGKWLLFLKMPNFMKLLAQNIEIGLKDCNIAVLGPVEHTHPQ